MLVMKAGAETGDVPDNINDNAINTNYNTSSAGKYLQTNVQRENQLNMDTKATGDFKDEIIN